MRTKSNSDKFNPLTEEHLKEREVFETLTEDEKINRINKLHEGALIENADSFGILAKTIKNEKEKEYLELVVKLAEAVRNEDGLALVVGGFARDVALSKFNYNLKPKDIDIEIYGISPDRLKQILERLGEVNVVGEQFGVIKLGGLDVSIPRRDSKTGKGHKGFFVEGDPYMTIKEAAQRRDFTINALALDPLTGEILDFYGGIEDIKNKTLRATDKNLFGDDPLRVLRAAQFAARFGFRIDDKTAEICRQLDLTELPKERVGEEWLKLLMKSERPSIGLQAMLELDVLDKLHPELKAVVGVPQSPEYHPEGDVWVHIKLVVDAAVRIAKENNLEGEDKLVLLLAALCHDLGKAVSTKKEEDGRITSHGHEKESLPLTAKFLKSLNINLDLIKKVLLLVDDHMFIHNVKSPSDSAIRRLARRLFPASVRELANLATADVWGSYKYPVGEKYPAAEFLRERAENLGVQDSKPMPLIMGRNLLALGFKLGKRIGEILKEIEELQIEGKIKNSEDANNYARVLFFLEGVNQKEIEPVGLLNGEYLTKEEMIDFIKHRFINEKVHDMGTLLLTLILKEENLPNILERNKQAILTAHKFGPVWFSRLSRDFYNFSWKSFYGFFESVDEKAFEQLKNMPFEEQTQKGLELILEPDDVLIEKYEQLFDIKPETSSGKFAFYNTDLYPFERGMFDGYKIMVQYQPERKRVAVSIMDEDPDRVAELDRQVRGAIAGVQAGKKDRISICSK